jgi:hypothetical protein
VIDRQALVARHLMTRSAPDLRDPFQVGNGRFAFNADITGLQSFVPFACLSDWAWHSYPPPADVDTYRGKEWDFHGRAVTVPDLDPDRPAASLWLDDNPHRLNLGRIGLELTRPDGTPVVVADLSDCHQQLDLWTGVLTSHVELDGVPVDVTTSCHPSVDAVAISVRSPLLSSGRLSVFLDFPDGDARYFARHVGDWASPRRHGTALHRRDAQRVDLLRTVDDTRYHVALAWTGDAVLTEPVPVLEPRGLEVVRALYGPHDVTAAVRDELRNETLAFTVDGDLLRRPPGTPDEPGQLRLDYVLGGETRKLIIPYGGECRVGDDVFRHRYRLGGGGDLELVAVFSPEDVDVPTVAETMAASAAHWRRFWESGGAIDLVGSTDPRAAELERRIVQSQYVMAVNTAGDLPPQETGLVNNSWHGKFHFEMYFWHAAHWALWGRWPVLRRTLGIYDRLLPSAIERARAQGFRGARWPKCTGPEGRESPGEIHALLVWQQPHVFFFAELDYAAHPTRETLDRWAPILDATADFLASYLVREADGRYVLGPPVHVMSENTDPARTKNPAFELAYWRFGLRVAQQWRERRGERRSFLWDEALAGLAPLPVEDGLYVLHEGVQKMWQDYTFEHPSLTGIYGLLPGDGIERATMRRTADKVFAAWDFQKVWGWDFPMLAMCAARLGRPEQAVDMLLHDSWRFQFYPSGLPTGGPFPYLPSSGSLLYAVAMMAAGWPGAKGHAPGFPQGWTVRHEGLQEAL